MCIALRGYEVKHHDEVRCGTIFFVIILLGCVCDGRAADIIRADTVDTLNHLPACYHPASCETVSLC